MSEILDKIRKQVTAAVNDYTMIRDGDRIMVAMSGGKDSTTLLLTLEQMRQRAPIHFSLHPVILDQKQPGFDVDGFKAWLAERDFNLEIIHEDTYSIVKDKTPEGKSYCGLCSRLRRGILYNHAHAQGFSKIALGHHRDDLNETVLLNMFFTGNIASMPPKLKADDGRNTVIRPLAYVPETWIKQFTEETDFPIIPCNLCGSQDNMRRQEIKALLVRLEGKIPNIGNSLLAAQKNIRSSQLLDTDLWDFDGLDDFVEAVTEAKG